MTKLLLQLVTNITELQFKVQNKKDKIGIIKPAHVKLTSCTYKTHVTMVSAVSGSKVPPLFP